VLDENPEVDHDAASTVEYRPSLALKDVAGGAGKDLVPIDDLLRELRDYVRYELVDPLARVCFGGAVSLPDPVIF
jgi:hypothetical protein